MTHKKDKPICMQCQIRQVRAKGLCSKCYGKEYSKKHGKTDKAKQYNKEYNKVYRQTDAYKLAIKKYNSSKGKICREKHITKKYGEQSKIYKKVLKMVSEGNTISAACDLLKIKRQSFTRGISNSQKNELTQTRLANKKTITMRRDLFYYNH